VAARTDAEARRQLVDAAPGTAETTLSQLVGHGVGQGLDRMVAGDDVAVEVKEGVELVEAQLAVAAEQGQTG